MSFLINKSIGMRRRKKILCGPAKNYTDRWLETTVLDHCLNSSLVEFVFLTVVRWETSVKKLPWVKKNYSAKYTFAKKKANKSAVRSESHHIITFKCRDLFCKRQEL